MRLGVSLNQFVLLLEMDLVVELFLPEYRENLTALSIEQGDGQKLSEQEDGMKFIEQEDGQKFLEQEDGQELLEQGDGRKLLNDMPYFLIYPYYSIYMKLLSPSLKAENIYVFLITKKPSSINGASSLK